MPIYYPPTKDFTQGTLGAELLDGITASATLNTTASALGLQNKLGTMIIDRVDANGVETPTKCEVVSFAGTSGSTVTTLVRGLAGTTEQDHAVGAIVEFGPDVIWAQGLIDFFTTEHTTAGVHTSALVTSLKASAAEVTAGTEDAKIATPKAIRDATHTFTTPIIASFYQDAGKTKLMTTPNTASDTLAALAATQTLTNKRITKRVVGVTTDDAVTIDTDTCDMYKITALAEAITITPGGTPTSGQTLLLSIVDNGTARGLTFDSAFRFSSDLPAPTTTVISKHLYLGFVWQADSNKWDCLCILNNF